MVTRPAMASRTYLPIPRQDLASCCNTLAADDRSRIKIGLSRRSQAVGSLHQRLLVTTANCCCHCDAVTPSLLHCSLPQADILPEFLSSVLDTTPISRMLGDRKGSWKLPPCNSGMQSLYNFLVEEAH